MESSDRRYARRTDPDTAHEAAAAVNVTDSEERVLTSLRVRGPSTSYEVAAHYGRPVEQVSPAFRPLVRKGLIRDSGERKLADTGRRRIVWELVGGA